MRRVKRILLTLCYFLLIVGFLYIPRWIVLDPNEKSLTILTWGDILDPDIISQFEKDTGIQVSLNYYGSNEELIAKLKATGGIGYDLIVPSDYAVKILAKYNLLKPLDKKKLNFWDKINPTLLGHDYDPTNEFAIPFEWEVFGLGYNTEYFKNKPFIPSWKLIFEKQSPDYSIVMPNDAIDVIQYSSFYLFGKKDSLSDQELLDVKNLLIKQRSFVEAYANFRADYFLATRNCPVVVSSSSYIWRTKRSYPFVSFAIPIEGAFLTIENFCIPAPSTKSDLVYEFINALFTEDSARTHFETYGFFPSILHTVSNLDLDAQEKELVFNSPGIPKLQFLKELVSQEQMQNLWISVKCAELK